MKSMIVWFYNAQHDDRMNISITLKQMILKDCRERIMTIR